MNQTSQQENFTPKTKQDFIKKLNELLPDDFCEFDPIKQIATVLEKCDIVLKPDGNWILVNSDLTLKQLLEPDSSE